MMLNPSVCSYPCDLLIFPLYKETCPVQVSFSIIKLLNHHLSPLVPIPLIKVPMIYKLVHNMSVLFRFLYIVIYTLHGKNLKTALIKLLKLNSTNKNLCTLQSAQILS